MCSPQTACTQRTSRTFGGSEARFGCFFFRKQQQRQAMHSSSRSSSATAARISHHHHCTHLMRLGNP
jgi:hypothetical protein